MCMHSSSNERQQLHFSEKHLCDACLLARLVHKNKFASSSPELEPHVCVLCLATTITLMVIKEAQAFY